MLAVGQVAARSGAGGELWAGDGPINGPANLYAFGLPVPHAAGR